MANIPVFMHGQDPVLYQDQLNQSLQDSISDNGFVNPSQSTANITDLAATMPNGVQWYDSDTHEMKIKVAGVVRKYTIT